MLPQADLHDTFDTLVMASSWQIEELAVSAYHLFVDKTNLLPSSELGQLLMMFAKAHFPGQYDCGVRTRQAINKAVAMRATEILADPQFLEKLTTSRVGEQAMTRFAKVLAVSLECTRILKDPYDTPLDYTTEANDATITLLEEIMREPVTDSEELCTGILTSGQSPAWNTALAVPWSRAEHLSSRASGSNRKTPPLSSFMARAPVMVSRTQSSSMDDTIASSSFMKRAPVVCLRTHGSSMDVTIPSSSRSFRPR